MAIDRSFNFRRVSEQITTSGTIEFKDLEELRSEGYEVVIDLLPSDSEYAIEGEREIIEKQGINYIHIPVDFAHPTSADYEAFANAVEDLQDKKVHIHCAANYRVSIFYSLYAVHRGRWTQDQADEFVGSVWAPADYPNWPEFIAEVKLFGA